MRNLKRALSLTLASVMLLGMMVVGTGAVGYPDVTEEENIEAIEVLQTVGVMEGDNNGNFNPDDYVTREQMAVIMSKLLKLDYNYYQGTNPFSDVPSWAAPYVAACAANGITSGIGGGMYGAGQNVSAVQAALMMLKALGYFQYQEDFGDSYILATVKQATETGLFDMIDSNAQSALTRNEVAQMALNALKSDMVTFTGDVGTKIPTANGDVLVGYKAEYTPRTSTLTKYQAIERRSSDVGGSNNLNRGQYYIQLGEELYNGNLKLYDGVTDDFGRPSRKWEYDGKVIGTYMKKELMDQQWTVEVKGKDLYDLLGADTVKNYEFEITIDGVDVKANKSVMNSDTKADSYFDATYMAKTYKSGVGQTGKGVLTQVFVDPDWSAGNGKVWVSVINTYLAKALSDYNEKKDEIKLDVYGLAKDTSGTDTIFYKFHKKDVGFAAKEPNKQSEDLLVAGEDFAKVIDMKKNDIVLVTVANGDVKTVSDPDVLSAVELSEFSKNSYVVSDQKYEYNTTIDYDPDVLENYTGASGSATQHLKDTEYNLFLDPYGYLIGIEVVEAVKNYIFLTGIDQGNSNLNAQTSDAAGILLDGTFINFSMNMKDSRQFGTDGTDGAKFEGHALWNTWCTYTKDKNDVYTLKQVGNYDDVFTDKNTKSGQFADFLSADKEIDTKHVSLIGKGTYNTGANTLTGSNYVYGNDDSIYMLAETKEVTAKNEIAASQYVAGDVRTTGKAVAATTEKVGVISGVSSMETGIDNVGIVTYENATALKTAGEIDAGTKAWPGYIYTLFDDDGYVIAAIVLGEDSGTSKNLVYSHKSSVESEKYDKSEDEWTWTRKVIKDGEEILLTQKGNDEDIADGIETLKQNVWYEVTYKADGTVKRVKIAHFDEQKKNAGDETTPDSDGGVLKVAIKAPTNKVGDFVCDIENLEYALTDGKNDGTTLYEEVWGKWDNNGAKDGGKNQPLGETNAPTLIGSTLYVDKDNQKGFYVHKDVKSVLIQKNNGSSTTSYGSGTSDLESFLKDLNYQGGTYLFKISAILTNGRATTVIIHDWNETDASGDPNNGQGGGGDSEGVAIVNGRIVVTTSETQDGQDAIVRTKIMNFLEANGYNLLSINTATTGKTGVGYPGVNDTAESTSYSGKNYQVIATLDGTAYTFNSDLIVMVPMTIDGAKVEKKIGESIGITAPGTGLLLGAAATDVEVGEAADTKNNTTEHNDTGYHAGAYTVRFANKDDFVRTNVFAVTHDSDDHYYKVDDEATLTAHTGTYVVYAGNKTAAFIGGVSGEKVKIKADMAAATLTPGYFKITSGNQTAYVLATASDTQNGSTGVVGKIDNLTGKWAKVSDTNYVAVDANGGIAPDDIHGGAGTDAIADDITISDSGFYKITVTATVTGGGTDVALIGQISVDKEYAKAGEKVNAKVHVGAMTTNTDLTYSITNVTTTSKVQAILATQQDVDITTELDLAGANDDIAISAAATNT